MYTPSIIAIKNMFRYIG